MNATAVIARELRAESRRPANYWLRVLAAGALISVFASIMLGAQLGLSQLGVVLFSGLNQTLLFSFWILVPLMTADCVSREKREGTLGLLFLTPLTVLDVIAGKATIHVLRALTLFVAALPVLGLPLFLGGVEWPWVVGAAVGQANAILLGIAAGIYASTRGGTAVQVMAVAESLSLGLALCSGLWLHQRIAVLPGSGMSLTLLAAMCMNLLYPLVLFVLILRASVHRLRDTWQDESATPERPHWVEYFSTSAFWQEFFYWKKSGTLARNPVAWLQEYSWTARLTKWGWFLLVLLAEFIVVEGNESPQAPLWQALVTGALSLGVAFSAVGSFRREQETGLLELLLVTPLSERQLLRGRLWGICCHYVPALAGLWFGWTGARLLNPKLLSDGFMTALFPNPLAFFCIVAVGFYLAIARLNLFLGWLLTWLIAFVVPLLGTIALFRFFDAGPWLAFGLPSALQLGLAALMSFLLHRKVCRREFAIGKSDKNVLG